MSRLRRLSRWIPSPLRRALGGARASAERWRVGTGPTRWLGPRHRRSRTRVEIDITWACNLRCFNCNRSCEQAPTGEQMTVEQVARFVDESLAAGQRWERIRVLGGEPTLHPRFFEILDELLRYKAAVPEARLEIATHGHGERTRAVLARLPPGVEVDDTAKESPIQPFSTFNVAPVDRPDYAGADYTNGCPVTSDCGIGLTPYGWYPCAVAGGIDRIHGLDLARRRLPAEEDDLQDQLDAFCRLCGHFKREAEAPVDHPVQSETWRAAYARWRRDPPTPGRY